MDLASGSNFPGLYSADSRKIDSDCSDDKLSKKDLLIGKRKDKKDKGYAALEGESSMEEDIEPKSPTKSRKSNPFKFSSRKEKREKSRDKEVKEKEVEKEKKKESEKEKDKLKDKIKLKMNYKKKLKNPEFDIAEELPIFGVPLSVAVDRNPCHDGVTIPLVVRNCIDFIEKNGLTSEGVYKITAVKSKVHHVYNLYNKRQPVTDNDLDLAIASTLLKQFLRSLPDPVLTKQLSGKFENITITKDTEGLKMLVEKLPRCNRDLLGWLFTHFKHVTLHEKRNKTNASLLSAIFCPLLQMSPRLFNAFIAYAEIVFPDANLNLYVPPIRCVSPQMPSLSEDLNLELNKQESLLSLIHFEMNSGCVNKEREDKLWLVQRNITQLKRKIKTLERASRCASTDVQLPTTPPTEIDKEELEHVNYGYDGTTVITAEKRSSSDSVDNATTTPSVDESFDRSILFESSPENGNHSESSEDEEMLLQYERMELILLAKSLQDSIKMEKAKIEDITAKLRKENVEPCVNDLTPLPEVLLDDGNQEDIREYNRLQVQKRSLLRNILEEKESIIDLKVQIKLAETKKQFELARRFFNM